ncbi:type I-E CRISPR-associated protein Cse1/CasA [Actinoallomurus liliacearum]|uniref:Type I-E CRISPR-associated protein Cse1/CasA n=1 Tax=Actinoallomurus liliacearum TaxID=1080073 RepID=A0ABP8TSK8_9ACTN
MPTFSLIHEPWLWVRLRGGERELLSLIDVLWCSHEIDDLIVELPTQKPAILRQVLLPVLAGALGLPADHKQWVRRFTAGRFTDAERDQIHHYLDERQERFDLFHPQTPFAQVADLRSAKGETKGTALIVATAAQGNNVPLFASRTEGDPLPLTPAQAARWLIHTHCWDTAAIKTGAVGDPQVKSGKTVGNPTGPLGQLGVVTPGGRTLFETLLLNSPIGSAAIAGTAHWERPIAGPTWQMRAPDGLLDLWTWQARRIRLFPEETPEGIRVSRVLVAAGDRLAGFEDLEWHTAWTYPKARRTGTVRRPRRHVPGKAIWRGLDALLTLEPPPQDEDAYQTSRLLIQLADLQEHGTITGDYPLQLETFGIAYGTQSAVIEDVLHDAIPLPVAALHTDSDAYLLLLEASQQAENLARAVNGLSADLRRAVGADPIPWDKGQRPGELVLHALDPLIRRLLAGVRHAGDDIAVLQRGQLAWEKAAYRETRQVAEPLFAAVPASAFIGREAKQGGKTATYSLGSAERDFRRRLNQILPRAAEDRAEVNRSQAADLTSEG